MASAGVAVVVGASRGLGCQLAQTLHQEGWRVFATCREPTKPLQELQERSPDSFHVIAGVDVGLDQGCKPLASVGSSVDLVICNAGILHYDTFGSFNYDHMRAQFEVNALGPLRAVEELLPGLRSGSKVVFIGSKLGSIANSNGGRYGYRMSKAATHMLAATLAADLRAQGVAVQTIHPGVVITDMTRNPANHSTPDVTPEQSARGIVEQIKQLDMARTGTFVDFQGKALPF